VIVGPESFDDAGVIDLGNGQALVQTVDFFPPVIDDPYEFGQIAAANSLSDIYAMGGMPLTVLNIVGFPSDKLPIAVLAEILAGGATKVREAGAAVLGGHSVKDAEIKYGLSVTGVVRRDQILTNGGARVGDRLVVTKPLGMGAITTGIKRQRTAPADVRAATATMATLNAGAARAVRAVGATAVTDITGFGLLGHGSEIARASNATLRFRWGLLPFTSGAAHLAQDGIVSGAAARSRTSLGDEAALDASVPHWAADLAFDAETSGGLLISVAPHQVDALLAALRAEQTPCAVVVGEVVAAESQVLVELTA
jgi:selenide, water dikinase